MAYELRKSSDDVLICEGAVVADKVILGKGVSVWYNVVLRGDEDLIEVGENTNIQDGAVMHGRTIVGRGCTIGHNAIVHACTVGDNTLIGMGAIILNGAKVGNNCVVGAMALITGKMDIPDGSLVLGAPAKVVRQLTEEEIEHNRQSMREYLQAAEDYRRG